MPGTSVKDWDTYHTLRDEGKSKSSAARIANALASRRKRKALAKSLSSAFGSRSKRKAQLISRLKRRRKYPAPVKGGTGKQSRHRAK